MNLDTAIKLLTDGCRLAEAYTVTTPEQDGVIRAGLRLVNRQLLRCGRIQTGDLSDQDRAAIVAAAKVVESAIGAQDNRDNTAFGGHYGEQSAAKASS